MSVHPAEPAARRGRRTRGESLTLPNLAVQTPRDCQIGPVAEPSDYKLNILEQMQARASCYEHPFGDHFRELGELLEALSFES